VIRLIPIFCVLQACSIVLVDEPCDTGSGPLQGETGAPPEALHFQAVGTGATHSCGILDSGELLCWGLGDEGQLAVPSGRHQQLTVGHAHACSLDEAGDAHCWGRDEDGQTQLSGVFIQVTAGGAHSCGLDEEGQIVCVGSNDWGQLDAPLGRYQQVAAGATHTCAVTEPEDGKAAAAVCWGSLQTESMGRGEALSVISGTDWACGAFSDGAGTVSCVGESSDGQHTIPDDLDNASAVAGARHGCGLTASGAAVCWGADDAAQSEAPDDLFHALGSGPTSLHTCGIVDDGASGVGPVLCWGLDAENQLTP